MLPSATVTTAPATDFSVRDYYLLPAPTVFAPYRLYQQERLSMRAVRIYWAMVDMLERRRIGKKQFREIRPEKLAPELAKRLGSDDHKRNCRALRELEAIGAWRVKNGVWCPAERIGELDIDPCERRDLGNWLASLTRRKRILIPRLLLEGLPLLNSSQIALNLELLTRCTWSGDKRETTATLSLHIPQVATRWAISERTVQYTLRNGLGPNVQLEPLEDTPGWCVQRHGCSYRVVIGRDVNILEPDTDAPMPESGQELSGLTADAGHDFAPPLSGTRSCTPSAGHDLAPPTGEIEHDVAPLLILDLTPPLRGDLHPSDPPRAANGEDTGAYQPEEKSGEDEEVTTGDDTDISTATITDPLPADSDPEDEDVTAPDLDPLLADTATPLPTDPDPEPESTPETPSDANSTLPSPDWNNLIEADLCDVFRLKVIYEQAIERGYLSRCESSWLTVVTAAVHARRKGKRNPCGLFRAAITQNSLRQFLTDEDEQAARALIITQQPTPVVRDLPIVPKPPALSPAIPPPDSPLFGSSLMALGLLPPAVKTSSPEQTEAHILRDVPEQTEAATKQTPRPMALPPGDEPVSLRYFSDARVLSDDGHLLKLYAEAVSSGLVSDDEDGFLRFVAAAEHTLHAGGVLDRPQLFKTIVRGKWGLVPNAAIDRARERLNTINFKRPSHGGPDDVAS